MRRSARKSRFDKASRNVKKSGVSKLKKNYSGKLPESLKRKKRLG